MEWNRKKEWMQTRAAMQRSRHQHSRYGKRKDRMGVGFRPFLKLLTRLLKVTGLFDIGNRQARRLVVNRIQIDAPDLPAAFDGYRILHLSDLHVNFMPGIEARICAAIKGLTYDLAVLTGDYLDRSNEDLTHTLKSMQRIIDTLNSKDGIMAVLGNHDTYRMTPHLEKMGLRLLLNESEIITRANDRILITGTDDPHHYFTPQAIAALKTEFDGYKIALVHTAELFDVAAKNHYRLYLCGHTHGGQICLPGGFPVFRSLDTGKRFYRGLWKHGDLTGYTHQGCGATHLPVRFFTQAEITLLTLKRIRKCT